MELGRFGLDMRFSGKLMKRKTIFSPNRRTPLKDGTPEFVAGLEKTTATALDEFFSWPVFQSAS
jgi:hypothetical protein